MRHYSLVVNDDDIGERAASLKEANGQLMYSYKNDDGEQRKAVYTKTKQQDIPESIRTSILGKRTSGEAIEQTHLRDYAFNEIVGGTKGEKYDYVLVQHSDGTMRYIPIQSKVKLNKKRKTNIELGEDGEPRMGNNCQADHILIAPRGLAEEDLTLIRGNMADYGLKHRVPDSQVLFKSKDMLIEAEKQAA
jgi:hypothetical protein